MTIRRVGLFLATCLVAATMASGPAAAQANVTVTGILVDLQGEPLASWGLFSNPDNPQFRAITNAEGRFSFRIPPTEDVLLVDGVTWAFATANPISFTEDVDITIRAPIDELDVLVIDENGEPLVGQLVDASALGAELDSELVEGFGSTVVVRSLLPNGEQANTGQDGIAHLVAPVGDATGVVALRANSGGPWDPVPQEISLDRSAPVVYQVPFLLEVDGVVVDAEGVPQPDMRVLFEGDSIRNWAATSGPDGSFVTPIGRGTYSVEITQDSLEVRSGSTLTVDEDLPLRLTLPPLAPWNPTALDSNGVPIENILIRASLAGSGGPELFPGGGPTSSSQRTSARTGIDGTADIAVYAAEEYWSTVDAFAPGGSNLLRPEAVSPDFGDPACCVFTFRSVSGTVVLADRDPVAGQRVELVPSSASEPPGGVTTSGEDGAFDFTVDVGTYDLTVRSGAPDDRLPQTFEVVAGDVNLTVGRVVYVRLPTAEVEVSVVDHLGQPVESASIAGCGDVDPRPGFGFSTGAPMVGSFCDNTTTGPDGTASFTAMHTELLALDVSAPGRPDLEATTVEVSFVSGARSVEVVLAPPQLTPGVVSVVEGDSWLKVVWVPVHLSSPASAPVTARWELVDSESPAVATPWVDFAGLGGSVTFLEGEDTAQIPIVVFGDTAAEEEFFGGEWGLIRFFDVVGPATLDRETFFGHGVVVIVEDDHEAAPA